MLQFLSQFHAFDHIRFTKHFCFQTEYLMKMADVGYGYGVHATFMEDHSTFMEEHSILTGRHLHEVDLDMHEHNHFRSSSQQYNFFVPQRKQKWHTLFSKKRDCSKNRGWSSKNRGWHPRRGFDFQKWPMKLGQMPALEHCQHTKVFFLMSRHDDNSIFGCGLKIMDFGPKTAFLSPKEQLWAIGP